MKTPPPARSLVVIVMVPLSRWGRCRHPRRRERWSLCSSSLSCVVSRAVRLPWRAAPAPEGFVTRWDRPRPCSRRGRPSRRTSAAPRVQQRAAARPDLRTGDHVASPCPCAARGRPVGRRARRVLVCASAVGVEAGAVAGADRGRGAHQPPHGSTVPPPPARTLKLVLIVSSPFPCVPRRGGRVSRWDPRRPCSRHGPRPWSSWAAPRVDGRSTAGASAGGGLHRANPSGERCCPGAGQPPGSIASPAPGLDVVRISRTGRRAIRPRRGRVCGCSSPSLLVFGRVSAAGVDAAAAGGADPGGRGHRQPRGSSAGPSPARSRVVVRMSVSRQPLGSSPMPLPARRRVVVVISGSSAVGIRAVALARADAGGDAHRRPFQPLGSTP